jgi:hypothetical protein
MIISNLIGEALFHPPELANAQPQVGAGGDDLAVEGVV